MFLGPKTAFTRTDAFDGGVMAGIDGNGVYASNDLMTLITSGFGTGGRVLSVHGDVTVTRDDVARRKGSPTMRSLISLRNDGTAKTVHVQIHSDLGSDSNTYIQSSSNGNLTFNEADRWIISADVEPGQNPNDPVVTQAFKGKGAKTGYSISPNCDPNQGYFGVEYAVNLPAYSTRYLLLFAEMNPTAKSAKKGAAKFDSPKKLKQLLSGISKSKQKKILNWDL